MDFNKNELINQTIDTYAESWSHTMDTEDFIDAKYLKKIDKYLFRNLKSKFNEIEVYNLLHLQEQGYQLGMFQKLRIWLSGLKPLYLSEKQKLEQVARDKEELKKKKQRANKKK